MDSGHVNHRPGVCISAIHNQQPYGLLKSMQGHLVQVPWLLLSLLYFMSYVIEWWRSKNLYQTFKFNGDSNYQDTAAR